MSKESEMFAAAKLLKETRRVTATHLPIGHSFIPYDILLYLFYCKSASEEVTVKSIFASTAYSDMGTRYHFNRLVANGWIELVANEKDTRMKVCRPTDKFISRFELIAKELARVS
jgi:DNA-binding MarR family transcriptional regulator